MLYFEEEEEEYSFLLQPRAFSGLPAVGGGKGPLPNICHTYPIMMKFGSFTLPKEDPKNISIM